MTEKEKYRSQMDALSFSRDFEARTAELMGRVAKEKENTSMINRKTVKILIAAAAAFVLLTSTVFGLSALLSARDVAQQMGDKDFVTAFESGDAVYVNQSAVVGDYELTLLGIASGDKLDFINDQTIENRHSYVVLAARRTDGAPIAPEDGLVYDGTGRELAISPLVEGWAPHMVNAWSLNCAGHGITINGVRYYLFDYTNLELFADRTVYLAVYEGLAPSIERFTLHEDGTITFAEGYTGLGTMFTLPVDPSRADPEAAMKLLEDIGVLGETGAPEDYSSAESEWVTVVVDGDGVVTIDGDAFLVTDDFGVQMITDEVNGVQETTPTTAVNPQ